MDITGCAHLCAQEKGEKGSRDTVIIKSYTFTMISLCFWQRQERVGLCPCENSWGAEV